ncbi:NRDE-2, necessary for RNA interference-domain-containing protein [Cunninghamella echinulata]|nr:NRDE-2, necessary for RNA interference-domain-containing protein [Cunninghamella echinulata]
MFSKQLDFIGLEEEQNKIEPISESTEEFISSGVDYRDIQTSSKNKSNDAVHIDEAFDTITANNNYVRNRTIQFNRDLEEDPSNVKTWLEFIAFQDETAKNLETGFSTKTKANKETLNEIKISIFNKALEHNPNSEELWFAYLRCGSEFWDTLTLLKNWDKALVRNPDSIRLWSDYINFRQTNFSSFSFDDCVKVFEDCIYTLHKICRKLQLNMKIEDNLDERENIESVMVYIVLRLCLFMKQSGYQERAFASIQAIIEFTLFQPLIYSMSTGSKLSQMVQDFCEFWDSEVPRFGEKNAKGWNTFYNMKLNNKADINVELKRNEFNEAIDDVENIKDWLYLEEEQAKKYVLSKRMDDIEELTIDDDPFRIILSDDISNILFNITTTAARKNLIYSVFIFLGLPYSPYGVGTNTHFSVDTFTHNDLFLQDFWPKEKKQQYEICYIDNIPMEKTNDTQSNPFNIPPSYPVEEDELFAPHDYWFTCFGKQYITNDEEITFTKNAFEQLLSIEKNDNHLFSCYLSFQASYGYKGGRKLAKKLLSEQRMNVAIWNAYAQMENVYNKVEEARKVYKMAIDASKDFSQNQHINIPLLHRMFAQLELQHHRPHESINILISLATGDTYVQNEPPPTNQTISKAYKYYNSNYNNLKEKLLTEMGSDVAYELLLCYTLLVYLLEGVDATEKLYQKTFDYIEEHHGQKGFISERIWVSFIKLLYHHAVRNESGYQPIKLRTLTMKALKLFPNNTILMGIFIWNESKTWVYNRVQNVFTENLSRDSNVILWLSYIYFQLHRRKPYDVNLVRTIFEEAVTHPSTRSSILLWKLYIQHEIRLENNEKAKSLLYRAVRECPWSKDLFMTGLKLLNDSFSTKELLDLTSLMMEKDIRTRIMIDQDSLFGAD